MSKERLEEIAYNVGISLDGEKALMSSDDYDFLYNYALQQAERVQELERELEEHKSKFTVKYTMSLREQNKRYREALERIQKNYPVLDADYVPVEMIYEIQLIISEALEGEK